MPPWASRNGMGDVVRRISLAIECAGLVSDLLGAVLKLYLAADKCADVEARAREVGAAFRN